MKGFACALLASLALGSPAGAADGLPWASPTRTAYVPVVKNEGVSRREQIEMTELLIKSVERSTPYKVVGSPEGADIIILGVARRVK